MTYKQNPSDNLHYRKEEQYRMKHRLRKIVIVISAIFIFCIQSSIRSCAQDFSYPTDGNLYALDNAMPGTINAKCGDRIMVYQSGDVSDQTITMHYGGNPRAYNGSKELTGRLGYLSYSFYVSGATYSQNVTDYFSNINYNMNGTVLFSLRAPSGKSTGVVKRQFNISHNWGGTYNTVNPTCTANGTARHDCQSGDGYETWTVWALDHAWTGYESNASTHWQRCTRCESHINDGTHYDNDGNGFCDACGRDIQIPKVIRGTHVKDNTGIWVYTYVQDNSGNVPYTRWWVWNTADNNWRYFDYQYTTNGDFLVNGVLYNRRFRVNISDYGNSTGPYHVDCRAYDATGLCSDAAFDNVTNFLRICSDVYIDTVSPVVERATYEADSTGYWVYAYATDNENLNRVVYPSWTEINGQDDIQANWSTNGALGASGSWTVNGQTYNNRYRVDKSAHNTESGPYNTHIYAYDASGNWGNYCFGNIYLRYLVNYIDIVESTGAELGRTTQYANYNSTVSGSELGTNQATSAYYENYQYIGSTSATVTDQGATVYRKFKLSTTTITFHDHGGSGGPSTVTWLIGSEHVPTTPQREGYNFAGWTTNEDGTGQSWPTNNLVPIGIKDYYAQWVPNVYTNVLEQNQS